MSRSLCLLAVVLSATPIGAAPGTAATTAKIDGRVSLIFASRTEAAKVLSGSDDFTRNLSPFDRSARMHQANSPTDPELRAYLASQALDWSSGDVRRLTQVAEQLTPRLEPFAYLLPDRVLLVKSTSLVEDGAAHTRQQTIVFPEASLASDAPSLERQLAHELFHIISRSHPDLRDHLYSIVGFSPCHSLLLPTLVRDRSITNPDAPRSEYAINVRALGRKVDVVPILQASPPSYDPSSGKSLFQYLSLRFLPVEKSPTGCKPVVEDGRTQTFGLADLSGFLEQVGRNTGYIIHPEEILADNFVIVLLGADQVPSPQIPEKMKSILQR
jgi:hypothetical protein